MDIGGRIYSLRHEKSVTAVELAERTGLSQSYISLIERGKRRVNLEILGKIAAALGVTLAQLFAETPEPADQAGNGRKKIRAGIDLDRMYKTGQLHELADSAGNVTPVKMRVIPVVSKVAAGDPATYTDGDFPPGFAEEFVPAPADIDDMNAFALRVSGDSMSPRFREGDIVICSPSRIPENGDAVVAKVNGDETTCKIFQLDGNNVVLSPVNPRYAAQIYALDEVSWVYPVVICQRREKR